MLQPTLLPRRLRGLVTDERGDSLHLCRGCHRIVAESREHLWTPGHRVVQGRLLVSGAARVEVLGELRVTSVERARVTATAAEVSAYQACFVRLLLGARGLLHMQSRFEARSNAHVHLHDDASGKAYDEAVIFAGQDWRGEVLVLGNRVRVIAPPGGALQQGETKRGILVRLAA